MRKEETFSINTGKRCRKRIHKAKFTIESDSESDDVQEHSIPKKLKASRAKKTEACCSASLASLIKERLTKESQSDEGSALCNDKCKYKKEALELKERVKMLENQIKKLNEQIDNGNGKLEENLLHLYFQINAFSAFQFCLPKWRNL
ncbi:uncharacterized protein LOC124448098 [Xenia sp. Carnegie-2017]|uniref:uncharacterized protein LOC124448098 n=1 Tax=Xenia sp. Carnegie-2017 TaxID=2897299 RepID=UPI001F036236|nr:uncharacterized protein LOC124448098 [Xenia sp. Carnegie-2017]